MRPCRAATARVVSRKRHTLSAAWSRSVGAREISICPGPYSLCTRRGDRKSTRLNSSHTEIYTLSLHDALPICRLAQEAHIISGLEQVGGRKGDLYLSWPVFALHQARRSEEHTSELQSHRDLHSFPTRRSSDLSSRARGTHYQRPGAGRWAQGRSLSVLARIRSAPGA